MDNSLVHLIVAYNAGETRLKGWLDGDLKRTLHDPLLFIESVPIAEIARLRQEGPGQSLGLPDPARPDDALAPGAGGEPLAHDHGPRPVQRRGGARAGAQGESGQGERRRQRSTTRPSRSRRQSPSRRSSAWPRPRSLPGPPRPRRRPQRLPGARCARKRPWAHWGRCGSVPARVDESIAFQALNIAVLTVSDTRTAADDRSGDLLASRIEGSGHRLAARAIVKDDAGLIADSPAGLDRRPRGRGRDHHRRHRCHRPRRHPRSPRPWWRRRRSRASASSSACSPTRRSAPPPSSPGPTPASANGTYIFCLPGSPGACRDGWDDILVHQLDIRHKPCNFAELIPRLRER